MATPKFNAIAKEFMSRINDPITESAGVILPGNIIKTQAGIEEYVNRALHKLMGDVWQSVGGDVIAFGRAIPELLKLMTITTTSGGLYTIAGTYYDFYTLAGDGYKTEDNSMVSLKDLNLYPNIISGSIEELTPEAIVNQFVFQRGTTLEFLPAASFNAKVVILTYIAKPVNNTDGSLFVSGGAVDSPYGYHWHDLLAQMAANMYLSEAGEQ